MPDFKGWGALVTMVIAIVTATAAAIWYFTPATYAQETRQMIVEMSLENQLAYLEKRAWITRRDCLDLKKEEWLCSEDDFFEYQKVLTEIRLIKEKLGIADL